MGDSGRPLVRLPGLERMAQRLALRYREVRQVGEDLRLVLVPESA